MKSACHKKQKHSSSISANLLKILQLKNSLVFQCTTVLIVNITLITSKLNCLCFVVIHIRITDVMVSRSYFKTEYSRTRTSSIVTGYVYSADLTANVLLDLYAVHRLSNVTELRCHEILPPVEVLEFDLEHLLTHVHQWCKCQSVRGAEDCMPSPMKFTIEMGGLGVPHYGMHDSATPWATKLCKVWL